MFTRKAFSSAVESYVAFRGDQLHGAFYQVHDFPIRDKHATNQVSIVEAPETETAMKGKINMINKNLHFLLHLPNFFFLEYG